MRFLYDAPAILYKKALIVGDTHFGMESKLRRKGVHAQNFTDMLFLKLKKLITEYKAEKLILLGDVKEDITVCDEVTKSTIAKLQMLTEVIIIRGNHDGGIGDSGAKIVDSGGMVYGKLGLVHGHSWPDEELFKCDYIVSAHQHPLVSFVDRLGKRHSEPAWIIADAQPENISAKYKKFNKKIKLVVVPAFNPLVGSPINFPESRALGPLFDNKLFKLDDALVFRLNGTLLGKLKNLGFDFHGKEKEGAR